MTVQFADLLSTSAATGTISADDILSLRRGVWADGAISEAEAHTIVKINAGITAPTREWTDFLVEAIGTWLVDEQEPRGYVDAEQGTWLIACVGRQGRTVTAADVELLIHVLERAVSAPPAVEAFVLAQIEAAICARSAPAGVSADDANTLRRILFAPSSDHTDGVSQQEAELLFRIKDAMLGRDNHPDWQRLFVQGVGNFLQGFSVAAPLDRAKEAELEAFMNRPESMSGFVGRMFKSGGPLKNLSTLRRMGWHEHQFTDDAAAAETAKAMAPQESDWLSTETNRDGSVDEYEQALLDFLKQD